MAIESVWIKFTPGLLLLFLTFVYPTATAQRHLPNIVVSTDIGGSDPDDYQSMVHLLMYADRFNIKGLTTLDEGFDELYYVAYEDNNWQVKTWNNEI